MSSATVVSTCNQALLAIGSQSQISTLNEASAQANACRVLYYSTFEVVARAAYWNCLRKQITLSLIQAATGTPENPAGTSLPLPPAPWLYTYQLPPDCLAARFIVPSLPATGNSPISPALMAAATVAPGQGQIPFKVAYSTDSSGNALQVILTNQTQAQLVYTVNDSNPQIWDTDFQQTVVASLAASLSAALTLNIPLMDRMQKQAAQMIAEARVRDANEGSTQQDSIPDWMRARDTGTATGFNQFGYYGNNGWWN